MDRIARPETAAYNKKLTQSLNRIERMLSPATLIKGQVNGVLMLIKSPRKAGELMLTQKRGRRKNIKTHNSTMRSIRTMVWIA